MNGRRVSMAALGAAVTALIGACSLDERRLLPPGDGGAAGLVGSAGSTGHGGGAGSGAPGSGGTTASGGNGSSGGATGGASATGSGGATDGGRDGVLDGTSDGGDGGADSGAGKVRCVYAGSVVTPGCETLVPNPGFATNVLGWDVEPDVAVVWDARDAEGGNTSGALAVTNRASANAEGAGMAGARRCLPANGGLIYAFAAQLFIASGQGQGQTEGGAIGVLFYESVDCSGAVSKSVVSPGETTQDTWQLVELEGTAPTNAKSMQVRLAVVKLFRQPPLTVRFDDLFVHHR